MRSETNIKDTQCYDTDGDLAGNFLSGFNSIFAVHIINSKTATTLTLGGEQYGTTTIGLFEREVKIKIVDELGNLVTNSTVNILDKNGNKAIFRRYGISPTVYTLAANLSSPSITLSISPDNSVVEEGDVIIFAGERMTVGTKVDTSIINVSRGAQSTRAIPHFAGQFLYKATTFNASVGIVLLGQFGTVYDYQALCYYYSSINGNSPPGSEIHVDFNDFTIIISKPGFETLKLKMLIDLSEPSADRLYLTYKLRHSPTPGRDEMGSAII
jgi:hypothetical protein